MTEASPKPGDVYTWALQTSLGVESGVIGVITGKSHLGDNHVSVLVFCKNVPPWKEEHDVAIFADAIRVREIRWVLVRWGEES